MNDKKLKENLEKYLNSKVTAGGLYGLTISNDSFIPDMIKVIKLSEENKDWNPPKSKWKWGDDNLFG